MANLKVYFDLMSQPSRAVVLFLKINNIPFTECPVALRKGEHFTDEYAKINPFHLVPVIDDNGFKLTESVAILKYLSDKFNVSDHWYPKDLQRRARVNQYLAWQHNSIRINAAMIFQTKSAVPARFCPSDNVNGVVIFNTAILRYLVARYNVPAHWYPKDIQDRAKCDEFCSWQHEALHANTDGIHEHQIILPRAKNLPINEEKLRRFKIGLDTSLDQLENIFLKDKLYLCGDEISIADLHGICELMQPLAAAHDVTEGRPIIAAWMARVKERLAPHFEPTHKMVYKVRDLVGANL